MDEAEFNDEDARALRRAWFNFLDLVEPSRPDLHRLCLRLTGSVWSAEDLSQETLLRSFGAIGRGDLHGEASKLRSARAYLFRAAANLWIDQVRREGREIALAPIDQRPTPDAETLASIRDAGETLFLNTAPRERAALVLKDAFDFSLEEIAELLSTTVGAVKAALHRGRARLKSPPMTPIRRAPPASAELVERFVAAFRAHDATAIRDVLLETVTIEVLGVGGGRSRDVDWADHAARNASPRMETREYLGELIALHLTATGRLVSVTRLEEEDGRASRVFTYLFAPDTLAAVAADLGLAYVRGPYHQAPDTLVNMVASTTLPWMT
ncbi:MAG TPA: RNA polymerase sigma factor [Caulobacteraceae bacterium]|jgi:RNA polymerase sigma-70 factor (ECF subfamily)|nr:RNA polymerase sigma factor [Caulobacteraceae bacterium]